MKKVVTMVLVMGLLVSSVAVTMAGDEPIKGGTIPGAASVGVDLAASKSAWKSVKEHFSNNWGKYTVGIITVTISGLVYVNNNGFHGKDKESAGSNVSTTLHDASMTTVVSGSYNTISIYSNRDSDNMGN